MQERRCLAQHGSFTNRSCWPRTNDHIALSSKQSFVAHQKEEQSIPALFSPAIRFRGNSTGALSVARLHEGETQPLWLPQVFVRSDLIHAQRPTQFCTVDFGDST